MQKESKLTRSNYPAPTGKERNVVHYTIERVNYNGATGEKTSRPVLIKSGLKTFAQIHRDLELQGYKVNILFHPKGEYNTEVETPANLKSVIADKDAEIAMLKAKLEAKTTSEVAEDEDPKENPEPAEKPEEKAEDAAAKVEQIMAKSKGKTKKN